MGEACEGVEGIRAEGTGVGYGALEGDFGAKMVIVEESVRARSVDRRLPRMSCVEK